MKKQLLEMYHRMASTLERAQGSEKMYVLLVYFSILLDNLLLTAVVPVIPDFLVDLNFQEEEAKYAANLTNRQTFDNMIENHNLAINGKSMAYLHHMNPNFNTENGQVGAILSSKAFVQMAFNPLVSLIINRLGYELTLILGVAILLQSSFVYLIGQTFTLLLVPRALQGIGSALINVSGMAMMANMFRNEEDRLATIGFCLGGMAAGVLIGYPFGGLVFHYFGKQILFETIILAILILLSAQLTIFNWSPTNAPTHYDSKTIYIITNPSVIFAIVIIAVSTVTMSLLESFLPLWLIKEIQPPRWELGVVFIPDSIGYLVGTNIFNLITISLRYRWLLVTGALLVIGISAILVPVIPNMFYLVLPHFGIGFGIGSIDAALMPLLAELVDEQFAAQYGYVYAAAQTAGSAAYAFGPLLGGALLSRRWLSFESLMHIVGLANLALCLLAFLVKGAFMTRNTGRSSRIGSTAIQRQKCQEEEEEEEKVKLIWIRMQQMAEGKTSHGNAEKYSRLE